MTCQECLAITRIKYPWECTTAECSAIVIHRLSCPDCRKAVKGDGPITKEQSDLMDAMVAKSFADPELGPLLHAAHKKADSK